MNKRARLLLTSALLIAVTALATACNAGQSATPTGPEIVRKLRDTMRDAKTIEGTAELSATINKAGLKSLLGDMMSLMGGMIPKGGTGMAYEEMITMLPDSASASLKVWKENPDKARVEVESSTLPGASGTTFVSDGQKLYAYNPAQQTLHTLSRSKLEEWRDEMKDKRDEMGMAFLADFDDPEVAFTKLLDATDIRVLGTEQLNSRDAYKLEATPKPDASTRLGFPAMAKGYLDTLIKGAKVTLWVDTALSTPLKATFEHPSIGTLTYTGSWKLNEPVDPSRFVLQLPPGTRTIEFDGLMGGNTGYWIDQHDAGQIETITIDQAREMAQKEGWKLLEPSYLPQGATLVGVQTNKGSAETFILRYSSPQTDFQIQQTPLLPGATEGNSSRGIDVFGVITGSGTLTTKEGWDWLPYLPPSDDPAANSSPNIVEPKVKQVKVRGIEAILFFDPNYKMVSLSWMDKGNILVYINGSLTEEEALKIAEGLK